MAREKSTIRNLGQLDNDPATGDTSAPDLTNGGEALPETTMLEETQAATAPEEIGQNEAPAESLFLVTVDGVGGPYYLCGRTPLARARLSANRSQALTFSREEAEKHAEGLRQPQDWVVNVISAD